MGSLRQKSGASTSSLDLVDHPLESVYVVSSGDRLHYLLHTYPRTPYYLFCLRTKTLHVISHSSSFLLLEERLLLGSTLIQVQEDPDERSTHQT